MPYIKPEQMIVVQHLIEKYRVEHVALPEGQEDNIDSMMSMCPVCGDYTCDKDVVKANGVFVHPEDVEDAEAIERGKLPGDDG